MKLTEAQRVALRHASFIAGQGECNGITPRRGQSQMFEILTRRRLLRYVGQGCHVDNMDREVPMYQITARGRGALETT